MRAIHSILGEISVDLRRTGRIALGSVILGLVFTALQITLSTGTLGQAALVIPGVAFIGRKLFAFYHCRRAIRHIAVEREFVTRVNQTELLESSIDPESKIWLASTMVHLFPSAGTLGVPPQSEKRGMLSRHLMRTTSDWRLPLPLSDPVLLLWWIFSELLYSYRLAPVSSEEAGILLWTGVSVFLILAVLEMLFQRSVRRIRIHQEQAVSGIVSLIFDRYLSTREVQSANARYRSRVIIRQPPWFSDSDGDGLR